MKWFNKTLEALHLKQRAIEAKSEAKAATRALKTAITPPVVSPVTVAAVKPADAPAASQPPAKPVVTAPAPAAIKPSVPAAAIPAKPSPVSAKPIATKSPFAVKPDFSALKGVERVSASMKFESDRKAYFLAEAERQIAAEEAAAKAPKTASAPTAENIASEILRQQQEAAKPKPSAWTRESGARRERVKKLAAELMAKDSQ